MVVETCPKDMKAILSFNWPTNVIYLKFELDLYFGRLKLVLSPLVSKIFRLHPETKSWCFPPFIKPIPDFYIVKFSYLKFILFRSVEVF